MKKEKIQMQNRNDFFVFWSFFICHLAFDNALQG